jgi:hypothetical protein
MNTKLHYWVTTILLSFPFTVFGFLKVIGAEFMVQNMASIHYNTIATTCIGIVELLTVVGLFFEKYRTLSLMILGLILAGAIGSHLGAGQGINSIIVPSTVFIILLLTSVSYLKKLI